MLTLERTEEIAGPDVRELLEHRCTTIPNDQLQLPGPDYVDRVLAPSDRPVPVLRNLQSIFDHGRLGGTGYLSILPVDQGVEHSAGASFAAAPEYFDPENLVKLAVEAECNAYVSTRGALGIIARKYAHKIPLIMKLNHNELLSYPNIHDQTIFASVDAAFSMGAVAVGATIYFGAPESRRQIEEVTGMFDYAHSLGLVTILWCYVRNPAFTVGGTNYETSADLSGQANHLGVSIGADIIKQKQPESNGGYSALHFGKTSKRVYDQLTTSNPIDRTRYQVANCYMGRIGLINSGGASSGENDLQQAVRTAIINKRAGGMGMIVGRKAFSRPMKEGIELLHAIQDVYLNKDITVA